MGYKKQVFRSLAMVTQLGISVMTPIFLCIFAGCWIDNHLGTKTVLLFLLLGVLAGAVLTAAIQSSSASVGILQALAVTGQVSYGAAVPIIMGQNIGTCVTAMLSSVGANKNAKRAAMVHRAV